MKESTLVARIIKAVKAKCPLSYVRKLSDRFQRGLPDIIIVAPVLDLEEPDHCLFLCVEAKNPSGKGVVSKLQKLEGEEINRLPGAQWLVATSVAEVIEALEKEGCC